MSKVIVFGGAGFIGTRLVSWLQCKGHDVSIFDLRPTIHANSVKVIGDVRDATSVASAAMGHDIIYNLAAAHRDDVTPVSLYDEINVDGARNVCAAATIAGIRTVVFTSSVAVYGEKGTPLTENDPHSFINDYGRTKSAAEKIYFNWKDEMQDGRLIIVRPTVVFGSGNRGNVYHLLNQLTSGLFVMVGDGLNKKSMAHVDNVARFLVHVLGFTNDTHIFNYADGPDFSMNELVSLVRREIGKSEETGFHLPKGVGEALGGIADITARILGRSLPVSRQRVQKFCANTQIDASKAFATGFEPGVSLRDGLLALLRSEFPASRRHKIRDPL